MREPLERLRRRFGLSRDHAPAGRLGNEDATVGRVVVDDQDGASAQVSLDALGPRRRHGLGPPDRHVDCQVEGAALTGPPTALGGQRAIHELCQAAADGKPQASSAVPASD